MFQIFFIGYMLEWIEKQAKWENKRVNQYNEFTFA